MSSYPGSFATQGVPGQRELPGAAQNQTWWGIDEASAVLVQPTTNRINSTAADSGHVSGARDLSHILRQGLILGQRRSDQKWMQWNPLATDGTEVPRGVLGVSVNMLAAGAREDRNVERIFVAGNLIGEALIVPGAATPGITNAVGTPAFSYEYSLVRTMSPMFRFAQRALYNYGNPEITVAADRTLNIRDSFSTITNRTAAGAVTVTLPAPQLGAEFNFLCLAAQNLIVANAALTEMSAATVRATATLTVGDSLTVRGVLQNVSGTQTLRWLATSANGVAWA